MAKVWTEENTAKLETVYAEALKDNNNEPLDAAQLKAVANRLSVTENSARQKLVSLNIYKAPEAKAKVGNPSSTRKIQVVEQIAETTGLTLDSLEKANKAELEALASFVAQQAAIIEDYETADDSE